LITRAGYQLATLTVIVIACSYVYEVAARYLFNAPTTWASAVVSYFLCAVIFLALPEQSRRGAHVAITTLLERAAPPRQRLYRMAIAAVSAVVCLGVFWICAGETWRQYVNEIITIDAYEIPKWRISWPIAYGLLSSALYFLRQALGLDEVRQAEGVPV
jgi:TRAP-type C4-dicarboxylate transport system permease small subunit